jgi:hypothetical protein
VAQRGGRLPRPGLTHIGLVLLTHQLGYFDILPLYVVLMVIAPLIALIYRFAEAAVAAAVARPSTSPR